MKSYRTVVFIENQQPIFGELQQAASRSDAAFLSQKNKKMKRFTALLRGINVGGKNRIKMADLKLLLAGREIRNLETYIQSGNLVFDSELIDNQEIENFISDKVREKYGCEIPVPALAAGEFADCLKNNPFLSLKPDETDKLHLTFFAQKPAADLQAILEKTCREPNEFRLGERTVYLYCPAGYSATKLGNAFLEKKAGLRATTRNLKTCRKLAEMLGV